MDLCLANWVSGASNDSSKLALLSNWVVVGNDFFEDLLTRDDDFEKGKKIAQSCPVMFVELKNNHRQVGGVFSFI